MFMVPLLAPQLLLNYIIGVQAQSFYSHVVQRNKYKNNNLGPFGPVVECLFRS